jgi:hypothetical protein
MRKHIMADIPGPHMYDHVFINCGTFQFFHSSGFISRNQKNGQDIAQAST